MKFKPWAAAKVLAYGEHDMGTLFLPHIHITLARIISSTPYIATYTNCIAPVSMSCPFASP